MRLLYLCVILSALLSSCGPKAAPDASTIVSMQVIDRNGFAETISSQDRIAKYKQVDFLHPQPYQKVLRVYGKNEEGKSGSKITTYHSNGHLWQYLEVIDGRANGYYREWYPNGQIKMQLQVIEGFADINEGSQKTWVFEGKNTIWDEDGHLTAEISYEKGVLHSPSYYYYPSGRLKRAVPYFRDQIDGFEIIYSEEGELVEKIAYKEGLKESISFGYWNSDQPRYVEEYEKGLLLFGTYYDANGKILSQVKEGSGFQAVFEKGYFSSSVEYQKGIPLGKVRTFAKNGLMVGVHHQKDGKKEGEEWAYFPQETSSDPLRPKLCLQWEDDMLQGEAKTWYESGLKESQRQINQNKKHGTAFAWYKNGDLMLIEEYELDHLTKGSYFKKGDKKPVSKIENGKGTATLYNAEGAFIKRVPYEKGQPLLDAKN